MPRRHLRSAFLAAVGLLAGVLLATGSTPASAATGSAQQQGTSITFFVDTNFTSPVFTLAYPSCPRPLEASLFGRLAAYDNVPAPGCQVLLTNNLGQAVTLCAGRHAVPAAFQNAPRVRVQAGETPVACTT